ncbi:ester cyclase family protein [Saccharopolyspora shandongensis]|uniref:nuclear transport factor 2 family protein n=1 Tax=Saccharopolyspora shandongensis TaxID=418495 RepID=UPI0033CB7FDF
MALSDQQRQVIARQWLDAAYSGDLQALEQVMSGAVIDHSGLIDAYGGGARGCTGLIGELRNSLPNYTGAVQSVEVDGDRVTIRHRGTADAPNRAGALAPASGWGDTPQRVDFQMTSVVRIDDTGRIVEHWAPEGPFGQIGAPPTPEPGEPQTGTPEQNKVYMQKFVRNVIDAESPENARYYFVENFRNHDPAPGENPGLAGATAFLRSIYAAFSGFQTTLDQQVAEDDLVAGQWSQTFVNTGPYLNFPASGNRIDIGGITITRVRDSRILEQWEARDAVSLVSQMGVPSPLGPLEDDEPATDRDEANKALARRFFYDVWSNGKLELIDELFAPEFTNGLPLPGQRPGVAGVRQLVRRLRSAFPDGSVSVDLQLATEDRVVSRYTFRGTHRGTFRGVPATGKTVEVTGIGIHAVGPGGRITAHWGYFDDMTLIMQLGLLTLPSEPPPGGAPPPGGNPPPGTGYPQGQQAQQRPDVTQRITVQQPPGQQPPGQQPPGQYQPPQQQPPGQQPPGGQQSSW